MDGMGMDMDGYGWVLDQSDCCFCKTSVGQRQTEERPFKDIEVDTCKPKRAQSWTWTCNVQNCDTNHCYISC